jgi:hypothetical protein
VPFAVAQSVLLLRPVYRMLLPLRLAEARYVTE